MVLINVRHAPALCLLSHVTRRDSLWIIFPLPQRYANTVCPLQGDKGLSQPWLMIPLLPEKDFQLIKQALVKIIDCMFSIKGPSTDFICIASYYSSDWENLETSLGSRSPTSATNSSNNRPIKYQMFLNTAPVCRQKVLYFPRSLFRNGTDTVCV